MREARRQANLSGLLVGLVLLVQLSSQLDCLEEDLASSKNNIFARHQIMARAELASDNIGRDGENDLRSVSDSLAEPGQLEFEDDDQILPHGYGNEIVAHSLPLRNEIYLLEDKDYPKSLFEHYPTRVGQVSGITAMHTNDVAVFHRSGRQWTAATFNQSSFQVAPEQQDDLIKNDTIIIIDREDGNSVASFGANLFYLPHSIASDQLGNLWVSDVARHQVLRLPASEIRQAIRRQRTQATPSKPNATAIATGARGQQEVERQIWPDVILGEAFVAGNDRAHFCQPAEIAVSARGRLVFVADGYCNQRVAVFTGAGKFLTSFGQDQNLKVVHSVALMEERNLICVADRENARILCYRAGLDGDLDRIGELVQVVDYPLGRVFAITSLSEEHLLVSSNQVGTNRYDLAILNPFTSELKLVWVSSDLLEPHSLTSTRDRQVAYAADISREAYKKVFKFNVIQRRT